MPPKPEFHVTTNGPVNRKGRTEAHLGQLGKFFGSPEIAPTNIAGFIGFLVILGGIIIPFINPKVDFMDFWKTIVLPIVTLLLGYLFGKNSK